MKAQPPGRGRRRSRFLGRLPGLLLAAGGLAGVLLLTRPLWSGFLYGVTGEETLLAQVRGGLEWVGNLTRPRPDTADFVPVANAGLNPFGVNTFLEQEVEPQKRERTVQMIADAGFHWIRQEFPWEDLEIHGKGDFQDRRHEPHRSAWEKYDQIVDLADRYGLEIIARLSNPPAWSRAQGDAIGTFAPPDNLDNYGDFVEAVVRRYRGRIRVYQIWNEPNIYPEWGEQPVSPEGYTALLKVGYTRIKAVCPECIVLSGALAQTIPLGPRDLNDFIFLQRMYDAGAGGYFDVLAIQGYGLWSGPTDRRMRPRVLNFSRPLYLREIMVQNGDAGKPIWITEMNWNAPPPGFPNPQFGIVTLEQQARYAVEAFRRVQQEWPWLGVVNVWFFKRATDSEADQAMYHFRLVEPDFTPMPIYGALKAYFHSDEARALYPGVHQEDDWALDYAGAWHSNADPSAGLGAARYADSPDATLAFAFVGTDLWLKAGPASQGTLACVLDDHLERQVSLAAGEQVHLARGLPPGRHHVSIRAVSGTWAVDSLTVRRGSTFLRRPVVGGAVVIAGLLVVLVVLVAGGRRWYERRRAQGNKKREARVPPASLLLLAVLLLAFSLRLHRLDAQSLWNDEGTSVAVARRDLVTIAHDAAGDIHPPLYYWLLSGWIRLVGTGEAGVRSLSALLGVVLVALTYALGRLLAGRWAGLAAAFLAAVHPFQVYYSQEARMYMLLAVWSALAFYAALRWAGAPPSPRPSPPEGRGGYPQRWWAALYLLAAVAGLYTHYAFPMVLIAINLIILPFVGLRGKARPAERPPCPWRRLLDWLALQAALLLLFLPWLPTAYRQLTTWPRGGRSPDLLAALTAIAQLLLAGPAAPPLAGKIAPVLLLALLLGPARRSNRLPRLVAGLAPVVWLLVPVALILGLGLFKEAYLKFLLVVSPAFCLLAGRFLVAPWRGERLLRYGSAFVCALPAIYFLYASAAGLRSYYSDPAFARDDYRGIAAYVEAVGRPGDALLLNAPGQQEVVSYYYHGSLPVYPLPASRPLDPAATEAALRELARPGGRVFALLWATDESDPQRFIEGWLDAHAYKALDAWYGHVRLAVYAVPQQTPTTPEQVLDLRLRSQENGDEITLLGYSLLNDRLAAGDIAQVTLFWRAGQTPTRRYKVFLHALDAANQIVGQRDAEPGGGGRLTTLWAPGEVVVDRYGLPIHPATPPGQYRVEVGMYDLETGRRLLAPDGASQVWLEPLVVERPSAPAPVAALGMQHTANAGLDQLTLLGYDAFRLGFAHRPEAALRPGDLLYVALYWRAESLLDGDRQVAVDLVGSDGRTLSGLVAEAVGGYPTSRWLVGDVWRGQFTLPLPGDMAPGKYRLRVRLSAPDGSEAVPFLSEPLTVNPERKE